MMTVKMSALSTMTRSKGINIAIDSRATGVGLLVSPIVVVFEGDITGADVGTGTRMVRVNKSHAG